VFGLRQDLTLPDAVPKKRGPKTDVLEALLKRVDGLEKRLHSEGKSDGTEGEMELSSGEEASTDIKPSPAVPTPQTRPTLQINPNRARGAKQLMSPVEPRCVY
jgi:hypothetical protein